MKFATCPVSLKSFKKPMLATLVERPFDKKGWIFETKWDGFRAIAFIHKGKVELCSREKQLFNKKFPELIDNLKKIPHDVVLDGEIVVIGQKNKKSEFQLLQNFLRDRVGNLFYAVFDILCYQKKDLTSLPLIERKKILKTLLQEAKISKILYSDHVEEKGISFFAKAKKKHWEGIMAKNSMSPYQFRRTKDWLKIKTHLRQEVVIGGYTDPKGSRKNFGALLLGVYEGKKLKYVGKVGGGFDYQLLQEIGEKLKKVRSKKCYFTPMPSEKNVTWVEPKLVCEVSFAEWTKDFFLRQPIFKGLRFDKPAQDVIIEKFKKPF